MNKIAPCHRVQGVEIDESELASLEEMIKEAEVSYKEKDSPVVVARQSNSLITSNSQDTQNVITRQSLSVLAGDENDLLSESPVFTKAKAQQAQKVAVS